MLPLIPKKKGIAGKGVVLQHTEGCTHPFYT